MGGGGEGSGTGGAETGEPSPGCKSVPETPLVGSRESGVPTDCGEGGRVVLRGHQACFGVGSWLGQ